MAFCVENPEDFYVQTKESFNKSIEYWRLIQ